MFAHSTPCIRPGVERERGRDTVREGAREIKRECYIHLPLASSSACDEAIAVGLTSIGSTTSRDDPSARRIFIFVLSQTIGSLSTCSRGTGSSFSNRRRRARLRGVKTMRGELADSLYRVEESREKFSPQIWQVLVAASPTASHDAHRFSPPLRLRFHGTGLVFPLLRGLMGEASTKRALILTAALPPSISFGAHCARNVFRPSCRLGAMPLSQS
mmetsp:Transcript_40593/g.79479  ORF Transcript_40593/g.79479 Transcript_40593/m.79479 type:complete len:215 (-) Transcript_40593:375-1019(-)